MTELVLGPLLRHVGEHSACLWVETQEAGTVRVTAGAHGEVSAEARTFGVHGHHYALVCVDGLEKGRKYPYTVEVDGEQVWPPQDSPYPPSVIPTLDVSKPLRLAFGSCRTSVPHDAAGNKLHGVDALRAYALRMARVTDPAAPEDPDPGDQARWPDLVLFLGDQVYADETPQEMRDFIESRRSLQQPPGTELKDYQEYAELYRLAWTDPANRWLLSTVPSVMIFDDHDVRDDWNTSMSWKQDMEAKSWWPERITAALSSYWVYQHLGNLTPDERAADQIWKEIDAHGGDIELDLTDTLDRFAWRADQHPESYRWSYARDFGDQARLVVVDARAARVLDPQNRSMLNDTELEWLDQQMRGDVDHLLVGTSLPFLLSPGLHYVEAWSEALAEGGWGRRGAKARREAPAARRPRALGGVPGRLPEGARDDPRGGPRRTRGGTGDRDLPLRRRAPQLRVGGPPERPGRRTPNDQPDHPGGLLPDPQPDAAQAAVPGRADGLRHRRTDRPRGRAVGQGARPAGRLDHGQGAVVRQQPGHARGPRPRPAHVVGDRQGRRRPSTSGRGWSRSRLLEFEPRPAPTSHTRSQKRGAIRSATSTASQG